MKKEKSNHRLYSKEFQLLVLKDYYSSNSSINSIVRKYDLSCGAVLRLWQKKYPITDKSLSLPAEIIDKFMKRQSLLAPAKTKTEELEEGIVRLRKALAYSELRTEALKEVIHICKEEYHIDLLKKAGAKQ